MKREQESSFCEIAAADLRVSKLDRLGEGFKQVHSVGPGVEKMGSEDCERHVETTRLKYTAQMHGEYVPI